MPPDARIEDLTNRTIARLEQLVAFDSVSRNSNLPIIQFIESSLKELRIPCTRIPSPDGSKSNLLARIGPEVEGGIILSGHTDVVPVDGQPWDSHPFTLTQRGNQLFGRGTSDMKSFLAALLALAPELKTMAPRKPLWLAFSYDEEIGCLGAPYLLKHIAKHIPKPAFAVIGEPTEMRVVTAHKGVLSFETTVHGHEGHSSQPHLGVNAVHAAARLVCFLSDMAWELSDKGKKDKRFDPPHTTVHVGVMHGGTARNIIPLECRFLWEIRPLPSDDADALVERFNDYCLAVRQEMRKIAHNADIVTRPMSRMAGVTLPEEARTACHTVMRAAQTNREFAVSFGTEAGVFNDHGVPAIICGPGSIEQAHKPNEFIEIEQIRECVAFVLRLAEQLSVIGCQSSV